MLTDEQLMERTAGGDMDAFEDLVRRHQNTAVSVAYRFLGDRTLAEDLAQDAFLKILAAAPRYEATAKFTTYLYGVVWRLCVDTYRKKTPVQWDPEVPHEADSPAPESRMAREETAETVRRAIAELPERQRMALVLQNYEDMNYEEIGEALDCSPGAVASLLVRARRTLEDKLRGLL